MAAERDVFKKTALTLKLWDKGRKVMMSACIKPLLLPREDALWALCELS